MAKVVFEPIFELVDVFPSDNIFREAVSERDNSILEETLSLAAVWDVYFYYLIKSRPCNSFYYQMSVFIKKFYYKNFKKNLHT